MITDAWTDRLSEYLDGELSPDERSALERHLAVCPSCTTTLAELTRVVMRARSLPAPQPPGELWDGIANRIAADRVTPLRPTARARHRRRWAFGWPELAAAAVTIALGSGGAAWWAATRLAPPAAPPAAGIDPPSITAVGGLGAAAPRYDAAVADLQRVLTAGRGTLDSSTVQVLERNLALIDRAIADAQRALVADPGNAYLNAHLARTMRQKLDLLRHAASLAAAQS
ncbi:MAG TPA: anti-sigma factor [Gemmatimonadales bacterium]|nr:anti-sigma factor [Gemmatimonadales bacterium]